MKIAVAYQNGNIFEHFGSCAMFAIYEYGETVEDCIKRIIETDGRTGHAEVAALLRDEGVDAVIVGGMGAEAKALLLSYGIVPVAGYCGDADTASDLLVTGQLPIDPNEGYSGCGGGCGGCSGCGHDDGGCGCGTDESGCGCGHSGGEGC